MAGKRKQNAAFRFRVPSVARKCAARYIAMPVKVDAHFTVKN